MSSIYLVKGVVKHYDWGGHHFLPALLNVEDTQQPFAEYWMGTHPQGVSQLENEDGSSFSLKDKLNNLTFLLKVLDVKDMLSIQVHPTKAAAKIEYERENREGIDLSAPTRNYKDDNHKPELMVALSPFWLLHGFKVDQQLKETLETVSEFASLLPVWEKGGNEALYKHVMNLSQQETDQLLLPLLDRLSSQYQKGALPKSSPDFWAARAGEMYCKNGHADRGIFSIYFFNLVHVNPGEAVFQDAGIPHAYLEGQNVEIMANSDNVLRGGLTSKHVDVSELIKHTRCEGIVPQLLLPQKKDEPVNWFETPVSDFRLGVLQLEGGLKKELKLGQPCFVLSLGGTVELTSGKIQVTLKQGQIAAFWNGAMPLTVSSISNKVVYIATSGIHTS